MVNGSHLVSLLKNSSKTSQLKKIQDSPKKEFLNKVSMANFVH
jgi:hypothetical protein